MAYLIDFDDPRTFPEELRQWDDDFIHKIQNAMNPLHTNLRNSDLQNEAIVSNFVKNHPNDEVVVYHCTRILDQNEYWRNGIVTGNGAGSVAEHRIRTLLMDIGVQQAKIDEILQHMYVYWNRDKGARTTAVHFFGCKNRVYVNDQINVFALNLGGETLRWVLAKIDKELYTKEPYKRLWILGTPSVIKFKVKLCNIDPLDRAKLIAEILKYYIMTLFEKTSYSIEFTGKTTGSVPPEDIISIEEIKNFIKIQEKYPEFQGFYNELKWTGANS